LQFRSFLSACQTHFATGNAYFNEFHKDDEYVLRIMDAMTQKSRVRERKMQDRHMLVPKVSSAIGLFRLVKLALFSNGRFCSVQELYDTAIGAMSPDADIVVEGYLFKRATNAFKQWHRRWFAIRHNMLLYRHRLDLMSRPLILPICAGWHQQTLNKPPVAAVRTRRA
jgi:hypothetical protein